ncbi:MAG: hypothetical protein WD887_02220 [Candidatus Saccharimonadales bacterium]
MSWLIIASIVFGVVMLVLLSLFGKKYHPKMKQKRFQQEWTAILERVKTPEGMVLAVIDADKLLDQALKRHNFRGKTVGEKLVASQRILSDNDGAWHAHKLRNRLVHEPNIRLKKSECQSALAGFKQALKDLGAL